MTTRLTFRRSQFIGLQILERLVTTRWKTLPEAQRQGACGLCTISINFKFSLILGVRNFVVGITVKIASDEATLRREKTYINKLNLALVQVCHLSL